jgi:chemotaxis methyl-accepting protein methylase
MTDPSSGAVANALAELATCAVETTGFRGEAISPEAIRRVLRKEMSAGASPEQVIADAHRRDPRLVCALHQAISVGETFFFRQPEQFDYIASHVQLQRRPAGQGVRAWSAGCATGEEAYSVAACLLGSRLPGDGEPTVLGTDLVERNIIVAGMALYRPWSVRTQAPIRHSVFRPAEGPLYRVADPVRAVTRFESRNLLDFTPPELAPFDVILCRNVLVYFTPAAAHEVCRNLSEALAPGGILLFGTMDLVEAPAFLERIGPPELQIFQMKAKRPQAPPERASRVAPRPVVPLLQVKPEPKVRADPALAHLAALDLIDRGEDTRADEQLKLLQTTAPDYVPGIVERALLCARLGQEDLSRELMRLVLRIAAGLSLDEPLEGPQVLPVRFYVASAEAFLERAH